jgi:hypothetical protein
MKTRATSGAFHKLLTLLEHLTSPRVLSRFHVAQFLVFCVVFCRTLFVILPYLFFLSAIVLSVLLRISSCDCSFVICKRFLTLILILSSRDREIVTCIKCSTIIAQFKN